MSTATSADPRESLTIDLGTYGAKGPEDWLEVDWSQHLQRAMIDGRSVNYLDYGDSSLPTVVMIHGLAGCWENWLANVISLSEHYRVVAIDLPGFGDSELPAETISIPGFADAVAGLLDHLEVRSAHVIGNSMGGMTALQLALDHPSRVERMVLVSPAGWSTSDRPEILTSLAGFAGVANERVAGMRRAVVRRPRLRALGLKGVVAHPELISQGMIYELTGGAGTKGFPGALRALLTHDFRDRLGDIEQDTLFIWGRRDGVVSSRDIVRFGERMPHAELIVLKNTGHVAMLEQPEWFNQVAAQFLAGQSLSW